MTLVGYELTGATKSTYLKLGTNQYGQPIYNSVSYPAGAWKVQNSWGTAWGNNGFFYIDIQAGAGVCGMNQYPWAPVLTPA